MTSAATSTLSTTDTIQIRSWWSDLNLSTFTVSLLSGLGIGVIIAGNIATSGTALFYGCIGTGGIAGGLAGPIVEKCIASAKHPARQYLQAPILNQSFTDESEPIIKEIVSDFEKTSWYKAWESKHDLNELCTHGVCYGVLATLVRLMPENHPLSSEELLDLLHTPENRRSVLSHQSLEFILADLDNQAISDLSLLATMNDAKEYMGYLDEKTAISLNLDSKQKFIASLPKLAGAYGIITFGKGNWGHGFFVQFDEHFRFCDTYNAETGLYEFPTQDLLLTLLYKQLKSYGKIDNVKLYPHAYEKLDK